MLKQIAIEVAILLLFAIFFFSTTKPVVYIGCLAGAIILLWVYLKEGEKDGWFL